MHRVLTIAMATIALAACSSEPANVPVDEPLVAPPELAAAFIEGAKAQTADQAPIADPYLRADASFSRFPLEKRTTPQAIGRLTNGADCDDDMILCEWEDDNGVRHIMGGDVLAIKVIQPAPGDTRNISALGIGTARQRGQVLKNVRAFIPEIAIDCRTEEESGEGDGLYSCGGSFEKGAWLKLIFDTNDNLVTARIDAFQIN